MRRRDREEEEGRGKDVDAELNCKREKKAGIDKGSTGKTT